MTEIYFFDVSSVSKERFEELLKFASTGRRKEIDRLKSFQKQRQSLFAELTLKTALSQIYIINNRGYEFERDEFGRLYQPGYYGYCFSISHSGDVVAVAVSRANPKADVGLDIEAVRELTEKHIARICTEKEAEFVNAPFDGWNERLLEVWTKKEAYVKSVGTGFLKAPCEVEIPESHSEMLKTFRYGDYIASAVCPDGEFRITEAEKTAELMEAYVSKNLDLFE